MIQSPSVPSDGLFFSLSKHLHNVHFADTKFQDKKGKIERLETYCFTYKERESLTMNTPGMLSGKERGQVWLRLGLRLVLTAAFLLLLLLVGRPLFRLFSPFFLALLVAWLLNPPVRMLQARCPLSRPVLSLTLLLLIFLLLGGVLFFAGYRIFAEARTLAENWQSIWDGFLSLLEHSGEWTRWLFAYLPPEVEAWSGSLLSQGVDWIRNSIPDLLSAAASGAGSTAMKLPAFAVASIVFVMGSYLLTADYPRLRILVLERMDPNTLGLFRFIRHTAAGALGGYVKAQFILSVGVFFILLIGFTLVGQSYAFLLALLLAIMDFIPIIGAGTILIPWGAVVLFSGDTRNAVELLVIWGVIALFRRVAEPKVVGNQTGLSPILSLLSIYIGMQTAGVMGMIFGPVILLVVINVCRAGVFDGVVADVRLAAGDIRAILRSRP